LLNSPLGGLILPGDEEALQSVVDISVDEAADIESGFSIRFKFGGNRFSRDAELVKGYAFDGDGEMTCTFPPLAASGCRSKTSSPTPPPPPERSTKAKRMTRMFQASSAFSQTTLGCWTTVRSLGS